MRVVIGADHAGFQLKNVMGDFIRHEGHTVLDTGAFNENPSDYPDYAEAVGRAILEGKAERGVLICRSGIGASIAANKLIGIRAAICHDICRRSSRMRRGTRGGWRRFMPLRRGY